MSTTVQVFLGAYLTLQTVYIWYLVRKVDTLEAAVQSAATTIIDFVDGKGTFKRDKEGTIRWIKN